MEQNDHKLLLNACRDKFANYFIRKGCLKIYHNYEKIQKNGMFYDEDFYNDALALCKINIQHQIDNYKVIGLNYDEEISKFPKVELKWFIEIEAFYHPEYAEERCEEVIELIRHLPNNQKTTILYLILSSLYEFGLDEFNFIQDHFSNGEVDNVMGMDISFFETKELSHYRNWIRDFLESYIFAKEANLIHLTANNYVGLLYKLGIIEHLNKLNYNAKEIAKLTQPNVILNNSDIIAKIPKIKYLFEIVSMPDIGKQSSFEASVRKVLSDDQDQILNDTAKSKIKSIFTELDKKSLTHK